MTLQESLLAVKVSLSLAKEQGATYDQLMALIVSLFIESDPVLSKIEEELPRKSEHPIVISCNTETAVFDDGSMVIRQRPYLNPYFKGYREPYNILTPDIFRGIFQTGITREEAIRRFSNPEEIPVDGDPGSRQFSNISKPVENKP